MAQHISISNINRKIYQDLYVHLCKKTAHGILEISGSLRYEEIKHAEFKITPADRVFITERVLNGEREVFELHYDTATQKLIDVFLVK